VNVSLLADPSARRLFIESIYPSVDAGRFPVKRVAGEAIEVWADIFRDGHAVIAAALLWRHEGEASWQASAMRYFDNDRWVGSFTPPHPGRYSYAIEAWTDKFATWRRDFRLKREAGLDLRLEAR
jgi:starch synthase (maltosyl-transferring)